MTDLTHTQIADLLVLPYLNHAVRMFESGYATSADIDASMRFGCGYALGPLAMAEERGLAQVRDGLAARFATTGDHLHQPADLLVARADAGSLTDTSGAAQPATPQVRHAITRVGVVGTGTMAAGIVQVFAQAGYDVVFVGRGEEKVAGVRAAVTASLNKAISRGKQDEAGRDQVLARLHGATEREALADVDLVVEAIAEDLQIKRELFADLDAITKPGTILATTTSSLPITELANATGRPQDVIGMHFFNPAAVMKLVEVVTTPSTAPEVDETVRALCAQVGKVSVSCADRSGFIVNALLFPYLNDAIALVQSGQVTLGQVDDAIKEEAGFPMGPFELLDVVGNDVSLSIQRELFAEFKEPGFAPADLLVELVEQGHLGRKSGRGFHDYR